MLLSSVNIFTGIVYNTPKSPGRIKMDYSYLLSYLDRKKVPLITQKRGTYLEYFGFEQQYTYVLRDGVVKTSVLMKDGREFNIAYLQGPDIISLLRDEVSSFTSAPFNVRVESETAAFYRIQRVKFWDYVNSDARLQAYVKDYYRANLAEAIRRQQMMTMNGKTGAVCAFLYMLVRQFGAPCEGGQLIDFPVKNEDIAGFCGISTRNSVNRILHRLVDEGVIRLVDRRICVLDMQYLRRYVQE